MGRITYETVLIIILQFICIYSCQFPSWIIKKGVREIFMKYLDENKGNWDGVCEKYSSNRKVDGHAIAKMAIENYLEMRDLVTKKDFIQKKKTSNILWEHFPDYFIPRYNMVSFTSIPYSEIYRRGEIQKAIIKDLNLRKLDMEFAEKLIMEKLNSI